MAGYLIAEEGPLAGFTVRFEEGDEWSLGRDPDEVTIALEDPMVSRKHMICYLTAEGYILENLSSVNPATQNGKVISEPVLLKEGDILQIGSTFFRFTLKAPPVDVEAKAESQVPSALHFDGMEDLSSVDIEQSNDGRWLLKVISGPNAGAEFGMHKGATYILGKDPNLSDIVFQDLSVSRQHARLVVDADNTISIEDLNSRNGVLINGQLVSGKTILSSQDLVAVGTTNFLIIDREQIHETIISPPSILVHKEEEIQPLVETPSAAMAIDKKEWKETIVPIRHLVLAGVFVIAVIVGIGATMALFKTEEVVTTTKDESADIREAIKIFEDIQFSYNPANGKLFLVGHVLTGVDKQELIYKINNIPFITSIDDNVVIDEYVWQNMNSLLMSNSDWQGVAIYSVAPGKFVLKGYLQTLEQSLSLSDYLNMNFPYLDRLDNQVVIETNLQAQIQSMLTQKGLSGISFQLANGEVVFTGRVDRVENEHFQKMVDQLKALSGIRLVKNFVVSTTADTSRVDISGQYQVSGYSKRDAKSMFVVINGKILSLGDSIDGMAITNILPNMILLEKDGLKFRINYNLQ